MRHHRTNGVLIASAYNPDSSIQFIIIFYKTKFFMNKKQDGIRIVAFKKKKKEMYSLMYSDIFDGPFIADCLSKEIFQCLHSVFNVFITYMIHFQWKQPALFPLKTSQPTQYGSLYICFKRSLKCIVVGEQFTFQPDIPSTTLKPHSIISQYQYYFLFILLCSGTLLI